MQLRKAAEADRTALGELAAHQQRRPDRHIGYLGMDPASIAEELAAEDDDWTAVSAVALADGTLTGWLVGSTDADMGRVWWFGPFAAVDADEDWAPIAGALYDSARAWLPPGVDEEEASPDARAEVVARWATERGFRPDTGSVVLELSGTLGAPGVAVRPAVAADAAVLGPLHDDLFPRTHTPGTRLFASSDRTHLRLVAEVDGSLAGYVAVERQPDGSGYVDYLGVAPSFRRRGVGADLVRAGAAALHGLGCRSVFLTVREDNTAARALYAGLGFVEERIVVPYRKGFSVP